MRPYQMSARLPFQLIYLRIFYLLAARAPSQPLGRSYVLMPFESVVAAPHCTCRGTQFLLSLISSRYIRCLAINYFYLTLSV